MRLISKAIIKFSNYVVKVDKVQRRNFARALNQEHVTVLNQETLTGRIMLYLNTDNEKCHDPSKQPSEMLSNLRHKVKNLRRLNTKEVIRFSSSLTNQKTATRNELVSILKELDVECYLRLPELDSSDIFKLLNVYMNTVPNRITEFKIYKHSIQILYESVHSLPKKDLLQLIFYIGLKKKSLESQSMLRQCMKIMDSNFIDNLTIEELCIICNSTFKCSTKINNKILLNKVRIFMNENLFVLKDCALFVTLVKTIRHNRYQDDNLLSTISCAILFNKTIESYSFATICHIMALYADYFYYEEELFKMFTKKCLEQLAESNFVSKDTYLVDQLRGKDIKRFLWVLSMFCDFKLVDKSDVKNVIIPKLIERINSQEFVNDIDSLIDITLYLWMINYPPYELVPYIFNDRNVQLLGTKSKSNLRLNLLLYSIYIEDYDLFQKLSIKPVSIPSNVFSTYQLGKRPLIQRLLNSLKMVVKELDLDRFELTQEIPHLNIIGITGYKNKTDKAVYIEVLDDYTRVKNVQEDIPVGLMALKLRLLDRSEEGLLTVCQSEVEDMTHKELYEYLLDELKLIC